MHRTVFFSKFILFILVFLLSSCTVARVNSIHLEPPTKSFVKILNTLEIKSCIDGLKEKCPVGKWTQMGSGMAIEINREFVTVISAGHVCDSEPNEKVKDYNQTVQLIDHEGMIHSAWVIHHTHYDQKDNSDLCLLWAPTLQIPSVKFSKIKPKIGQEIFYIGAPKGVFHPPTVPIFKGIYSGEINNSASMATFPATGGSSGSAVLNDKYKIIGVVFAANREFHHITLITSHKSFLKFLQECKIKLNSIQL